MRICLVDPAFLPHAPAGGQMLLLAQELARDHEVTVVASSVDPQLREHVRWVPITLSHGFVRGGFSLRRQSVLALAEMSRKEPPFDLVHTTFPVRLPVGATRAHVVTWHYCAADAYRVWLHGGMRYRGRVWSNKFFYNVSGWLRRGPLPVVLERLEVWRSRSQTQLWVAVSRGLADALAAHLRVERQEIAVVPNAVHPRYFAPPFEEREPVRRKMGVSPGHLLAVTVAHGQWNRKGTFELLAALRLVNVPLKLAVVGGSRLEHLRREVKALGIEDRVFLCGFGDPLPYLVAADVFVLPSWWEGFPLAPAEAAAVGVPVISSRTHGVVEWLEHGQSGLFCERDAASIARCLDLLGKDAELRRRLGHSAQKRVAQYTPQAMARGYTRIYEEAVSTRRPGSTAQDRPQMRRV
jgi:glycosyltransferase involved in cell wall biosynthesis